MPPGSYIWPLELAAKNYELTGKNDVFAPALLRAQMWPRTFFHAPDPKEAGHQWDWFGNGPGPLGDDYAYMSWGIFAKALRDAGIQKIPTTEQPRGGYPFTPERWNHPDLPASIIIYALEPKDQELEVRFGLDSLGGSLGATSSTLIDPAGKPVLAIARIGTEPDKNVPLKVAADGQSGLYRLEFRGHEAFLPMPQTNLPHEAALLNVNKAYRGLGMRTYIQPSDGKAAYDLIIRSESPREPTNFFIRDATGKTIAKANLFSPLAGYTEKTVRLDPTQHPVPWLIDIIGKNSMTFNSETTTPVLASAASQNLKVIADALKAAGK